MKRSHKLVADGNIPIGAMLTKEIDKNRRAAPKDFVPYNKRPKGDPNDPFAGVLKRPCRKPITLAKRAEP